MLYLKTAVLGKVYKSEMEHLLNANVLCDRLVISKYKAACMFLVVVHGLSLKGFREMRRI